MKDQWTLLELSSILPLRVGLPASDVVSSLISDMLPRRMPDPLL